MQPALSPPDPAWRVMENFTGELHLVTIWSADTPQGHEVRVLHPDIPVADAVDAARTTEAIHDMTLASDGGLTYVITVEPSRPWKVRGTRAAAPKCRITKVNPENVRIYVYTRPVDRRGERFLPDATTPEGRAVIASTMIDPRYNAEDGDYAPTGIGLVGLAALAGAAGRLSSTAFDLRSTDDVRRGVSSG